MRCLILFAVISAVFLSSCGSGAPDANVTAGEPQAFTDANAALAEGIRLLDTGETDRAIEVLNQAIALDPDLAEAHFRLGIAYALIEMRDASEIIGDGNSIATNEKPRSVQAFERAAEAYKKLIAANKEDHAAYFNLGRAYNKLNEDEDAEAAFRKAVELHPEDTEYQTALGEILIKLAKYREAIPPLKKAIELDPDNIEAQELLEDAEAGRSRVSYQSTPKKETNTNANTNSNTSLSNTSTSNTPTPPRPTPVNTPPPPKATPNRPN